MNLWRVTIAYPDNAKPTIKEFENSTKMIVYLSKIPMQIGMELYKTATVKIDRLF